MGKFINLQTNVFSIFDSAAWKAENIKTFPSNFTITNAENNFIRVSVIPSGNGINIKSVSGIVIIDIFTSANGGPKATMLIADKLDLYLVGKTFRTQGINLCLANSSLSFSGIDKDNPSLYKAAYTVPFNYFEVQ